jgi:hypothetical protein
VTVDGHEVGVSIGQGGVGFVSGVTKAGEKWTVSLTFSSDRVESGTVVKVGGEVCYRVACSSVTSSTKLPGGHPSPAKLELSLKIPSRSGAGVVVEVTTTWKP